jgi:prevent-host-death family protein
MEPQQRAESAIARLHEPPSTVHLEVSDDRKKDRARCVIPTENDFMQIFTLAEVKKQLSEVIDAVINKHEPVTITSEGEPAAVLIGADDWESLQEKLFWLAQPGIKESIQTARAGVAAGVCVRRSDPR